MADCVQVLTTVGSEEEAGVIAEVHSYDEPEIIATPIVAGSAGYLAWIAENVDD